MNKVLFLIWMLCYPLVALAKEYFYRVTLKEDDTLQTEEYSKITIVIWRLSNIACWWLVGTMLLIY